MSAEPGKHGKRTKTGCLTCRKRHYKCDEAFPQCSKCSRAGLECRWSDQIMARARRDQPGGTSQSDSDSQIVASSLSTHETDALSFYIHHFHSYSYQICAWTGLITLPRRSGIPSVLQFERRIIRKMTNWANFFLPHLASGTADDPLSLALGAFTAHRMQDEVMAVSFYARALSLLRATLHRRNAASMGNQEFLRIWATTLLLAEYEAHQGNQKFESQHVEGATTLSFIAASRFTLSSDSSDNRESPSPARMLPPALVDNPNDESSSTSASVKSSSRQSNHVGPEVLSTKVVIPRNERELPAFLMQLTQRLRHSSLICESLDSEWPTFQQPPIERGHLGGLLEKSAECYAHVMPLVEDFYTRMSLAPPPTTEAYIALLTSFAPRVSSARQCIAEYVTLLDRVSPSSVYQSCAEPGFPFSPVIKFVNPHMAQPTVIPHVFMIFLAPFLPEAEFTGALRYISGVFAGFEDVPGLRMDASFPDLYVAAFWKPGLERMYFHREVYRRKGDFMHVLSRVWTAVDALGASRGVPATNTEILGISLREYRDAQLQGLRLQNTRH